MVHAFIHSTHVYRAPLIVQTLIQPIHTFKNLHSARHSVNTYLLNTRGLQGTVSFDKGILSTY